MRSPRKLLTASRVARFKECRRRDFYENEMGLRPVSAAYVLRWGICMHGAIDALATGGLDAAIHYIRLHEHFWSEPFTGRTLEVLITRYDDLWTTNPTFGGAPTIAGIIASEQVWSAPLRNPETPVSWAKSTTWELAGKKDQRVKLCDGRRAILETKTTGHDITDDRYWRRLRMDGQISMYMLSEEDEPEPAETLVYNVIRRPTIAPLKATPEESRKYRKDGELYANQRANDEMPQEWADRLSIDIGGRPEWYFARREIPRLEADMAMFRQELWDVAKDIRAAQLTNRWYRNVQERLCPHCPFFDVCCGLIDLEQTPVPDGFEIIDDIHPELRMEEANGNHAPDNGPTAEADLGGETATCAASKHYDDPAAAFTD